MKLHFFSNNLQGSCAISRVLLYSTKTVASSSLRSNDSLYGRITSRPDPQSSIVPVLNQWLEEAKDVKPSELQKLIKQLRSYKRFNHALELSNWMSDQRSHDPSPGEVAVQLDLISKVHGLEEAENYFNIIPDSLKVIQVYGALLNCYTHDRKCLDKAEALMQKMRELGFLRVALPYNSMLNLYSRMGQHEKLDTLLQEMEEKGIDYDNFTYNIRLKAYVAACDLEGMEKLVANMEVDPIHSIDWHAYVIAATGYLKAGRLEEKAVTMLKKSEQLVTFRSRRKAYEIFLTLYSSMGEKDEVYRIWNLTKRLGKVLNSGYVSMLSSLGKMGDIEGAEKIFEEWRRSGYKYFDIRIPNLLIVAYCKRGLLDKAETCINGLVEEGKEPASSTWDHLATGHRVYNQMEKAVALMKNAVLTSTQRYRPNQYTVAACIEFLKKKGDVKEAEEFLGLLREKGHFTTNVCDSLVDYINNGKGPSALELIEVAKNTALDGEMQEDAKLKDDSS